MKTGFISDLHIDINKEYPVLEMTAEAAKAQGVELLIVAGDMSETQSETIAGIEKLEQLCGFPVLYVPGNHDMWNKNMPKTHTREIYQMYKLDQHCLCGKTLIINGKDGPFGLVGDIGWYDYSFASKEYTKEQLDGMSLGGRTWQDKLYNEWTRNNKRRMAIQVMQLEEQIKACKDLPVVCVTHMLPVDDFCVPTEREGWGFFNAFLGGSALEELYKKYNVKVAVCGHVHYRKQCTRDGILQICPCVGYFTEWYRYDGDPDYAARNIRESLQVIDL